MARRRARWFGAAFLSRALPSLFFLSLGGITVGVPACGGTDPGPPIPIEDLAKQMADALCNNVGPCCEQEGFSYNAVQCHATAEADLMRSIASYNIEGVNYDANAARACANAYAAMAQSCGDPNNIEGPCEKVFTGARMPGETCTSSNQCALGGGCGPSTTGVSQCGAAPKPSVHGKKGESCSGTCTSTPDGSGSCFGMGGPGVPTGVASCYTNDGLYCAPSTFVCTDVPALGQACTTGNPCSGNAFCENGVCATKRTSGSCAAASDACAAPSFCNFATQQCEMLKPTGAACVTGQECSSTDRCANGICHRRTIASTNTCAGRP